MTTADEKMREEFQTFLQDFESDYDRQPSRREVWQASSAQYSARIQELEQQNEKLKAVKYAAERMCEAFAKHDDKCKRCTIEWQNLKAAISVIDNAH